MKHKLACSILHTEFKLSMAAGLQAQARPGLTMYDDCHDSAGIESTKLNLCLTSWVKDKLFR